MTYYIVYSYGPSYGCTSTKYIRGIYRNIEDAKKRQLDICGNEYTIHMINKSVHGNGITSFINVIPDGDCNVEMFTT